MAFVYTLERMKLLCRNCRLLCNYFPRKITVYILRGFTTVPDGVTVCRCEGVGGDTANLALCFRYWYSNLQAT